MPRIPPTSAKWYLYEISRTRLHWGEAKKKRNELSNFKYNWKTDLWKIFSHLSPTLWKNECFMLRVSGDLEELAGLSGGGCRVAWWVVGSLWASLGYRACGHWQRRDQECQGQLGLDAWRSSWGWGPTQEQLVGPAVESAPAGLGSWGAACLLLAPLSTGSEDVREDLLGMVWMEVTLHPVLGWWSWGATEACRWQGEGGTDWASRTCPAPC